MNAYRVVGNHNGTWVPEKLTFWGWRCISWMENRRRYRWFPWYVFKWNSINWFSKAEYAWEFIQNLEGDPTIGTLYWGSREVYYELTDKGREWLKAKQEGDSK